MRSPQTITKYEDRKKDYFRYNLIRNKVASFAEPLHSNKYTSTLDIINSARHLSRKNSFDRSKRDQQTSVILPSLNINKATFTDASPEPLDPSKRMTEEQKTEMRKKCKNLINRCLSETQDINIIKSNLEMAFKEIGMKDEQFNQVLSLLRDLENNESHIIELMFLYKLNERDELDKEAKKVTYEFHTGALDPNNKNSKYE